MTQEIREFYSNYFAIDLTDEDISQILSGEGMRSPKEGRDNR